MAAKLSGLSKDGARMKLLCSYGGLLKPHGSNGDLRYVGGETRVLVVPRAVTFKELRRSLEEMAGAELAAVKYRLDADGFDDVLVSVTCDTDLAYMRDEYFDLLEARRSLPMRLHLYVFTASSQRLAAGNAVAEPLRRVKSAQELDAASRPKAACCYHCQKCRCFGDLIDLFS